MATTQQTQQSSHPTATAAPKGNKKLVNKHIRLPARLANQVKLTPGGAAALLDEWYDLRENGKKIDDNTLKTQKEQMWESAGNRAGDIGIKATFNDMQWDYLNTVKAACGKKTSIPTVLVAIIDERNTLKYGNVDRNKILEEDDWDAQFAVRR